MSKISIIKIVESTSVDGPGLRTSIYSAGCTHHCPMCHNPQTLDIAAGTLPKVDEILAKVLADDFANVTFSGGDPMLQARPFAELAQKIKLLSDKTIWCYTGYSFDEILEHPMRRRLLESVDVVVDGRFVEELKDEKLIFRGSSNQRIIDVRKSLEAGEVVEFRYNPFPEFAEELKEQRRTMAY